MAALQGGNGCDVVTVRVHFHNDVEFPVHGRILLHPARPARGKERVSVRVDPAGSQPDPGLQGGIMAEPGGFIQGCDVGRVRR